MGLGYVLFIIPHKIVPGGIFGFSIIINHLTSWPIGGLALALNIPLLLWGIKTLGSQFGFKTVIAMVLGSLFIDGLTWLFQGFTPTQDILVSTIFGGALIGTGIALVIKAGATTGGTDIIARIFSYKLRVPIGKMFILIDGIIVLTGVIIFHDFNLALYCIIAIFCISKSVDLVLNGLEDKKAAIIISEKHEQIREQILGMDCGGTYLHGEGLYFPQNSKKIIFTALDRKELAQLERAIKTIDPEAFITTMSTTNVYGHGFKPIE